MKSICIFFILVFTHSITNAQTNLDSLYTVWQDKTKADSSRTKALDDYIWFGYLFSQPDSALTLIDTLFDFSSKRNLKKVMATALNMKGVAYNNKTDYRNALNFYQKSLKIHEEIEDKRGIASSLGNIAIVLTSQGNGTKALEYLQRSIIIYERLGHKNGVRNSLNNIGNIYAMVEDYSNALVYYQRALNVAEEIGGKRAIAYSLNNIGGVYYQMELNQKALNQYNRSLIISEDIDDKVVITGTLNNIGDIYESQGNFIKALDYFYKSYAVGDEIGYNLQVSNSLSHIGNIYINQAKYREAIEYCKKSRDLAEKIVAIDFQKDACECLYNAYKALGNGNKALAYHEQMLVLNDSLQTEETAKKLQRMEFDKQVLADSLLQVEKDLKVEMSHQTEVRKKDKNKDLALGAGIFFLLLSGGFYGRWRYVKKSKAVIEKEKDRSENLLLNILPSEIAEELKAKGSADARDFEMVSILFTDFKGFTKAAEKLSAKELIGEINHCFMAFDHICEKHRIEKIKTIGDAYMAAGGLPIPSDDSVKNVVLAALDMQSFIANRIIEKQAKNETPFEMRLGIHTGPVVAGIVGVKKFQYDIWGDTVNTASRLESTGDIGKVNISQDTYALIKDDPQFNFESRGKIQAKNKGEIEMYFVTKVS